MSATFTHYKTVMSYIPNFDGNPEKFVDWLNTIEGIFDYEKYDDSKRCEIAAYKLTERAYSWYEDLQISRGREGKEHLQSWEKLKKPLKRKFLPRDYEQKQYFQHIKSQVVHRKQEEHKRLFLDTRELETEMKKKEKTCAFVCKPSYVPTRSLPDVSNHVSTMPKSKEASYSPRKQQPTSMIVLEHKEAARPAMPIPSESSHDQLMITPYEISHDQEEQQTMAEIPHLARVKSPMKSQGEAIQEEPKQPTVLQDETGLLADLSVLPIEDKRVNEDDLVQEETEIQEPRELPITSLTKEQGSNEEEESNMLSTAIQVMSLPSDCNDSPSTPKTIEISKEQEKAQPVIEVIQRDIVRSSTTPQTEVVQQERKQPINSHDQIEFLTDLRMHEVPNQEREASAKRKHGDTQGTNQNKQGACVEPLYSEYMYYNSFFSVLIDQDVHARSGLKLLLYDLRFEVESLQERECDAGARGPNAYPKPSHVYPSSLGSKQASHIGSASKTVIKNLFLDIIGLNYEILKRRDDKAHETESETTKMSRRQKGHEAQAHEASLEVTMISWVDDEEDGT